MSPHYTPPIEATSGDVPYIFISYSHRDAVRVYPEIERIHREGYAIWYDEGIDPGNEWPQEIAKALEGCTLFISFVSANSANSNNCRNEINYALNQNKQFLAIYLEETELPGGLALRMGDLQAVMKYRMDPESYAKKIGKALDTYLEKGTPSKIPTPTPSPKAMEQTPQHQQAVKGSPPALPPLNMDSEEVSNVVALALRLKEQLRDKLNESEVEEVCQDLGVTQDELRAALQHLQKQKRRRHLTAITALALIIIMSIWWLISWTNQPVISDSGHQTLQEDMKQREQELVKKTPRLIDKNRKLTLAVLPFQNQSGNPDLDGLAASCGEAMMIPLANQPRLTLIERMQLSKVIQEIDFNQTKYIDPQHAVELGKVMNADYVIIGSLQMANDKARISARLVDVEDGGIVHQERVEGSKDELFELQDVLAHHLASKF